LETVMKARLRQRVLLTTGTVTALAVTGPLAGVAMAAALTFSTYLGGTNDEAAAWFSGVVSIAVDDLGNRYVTGSTRSPDFPTTEGAKRTLSGDIDVFVAKIAPGGTILYSTYLGGPCDDAAVDIAVDPGGNAYVTGRIHGGVCTEDVNAAALVAKLDPTGGLVWAAALGGSLADTSIGQAIAVDAAGHAYVAGTTSSHDFPITAGAFRTRDCSAAFSAGADGFVAKLSTDGTTLEYSTFLCGTAHESLNGIAVDAAGSAYVVGSTESKDFPTLGAIQTAPRGGPTAVTGFLTKLLPDGSGLAYSTYLGGSTNDIVGDVALDAQGNVYLTGETQSDDFPTTPGVVQEHPGNRLCFYTLCSDAFVTKIDPSGGAFVYSTLLFGEGNDAGSRIAVDNLGDAYVIGSTASLYFPIVGAFQPASRGPGDAFVTKLSPDATRLLYSSYLGGSHTGASPLIGEDAGSGIAVDWMGNAHVAGYTLSFDFPTTENATQKSIGDGVCDVTGTPCGDAFVAMIWADGPRTVPAIDLVATPTEDGSVTATWRGLPGVTAEDQVRLYPLGAYGADSDALEAWSTDGFTDGTVGLILPGGLPLGWYELRLLIPDPESGLLTTVARSEPFRVGTPGTTTPTGPSTCESDAACDDGDPCTVDVCAVACISKPAAGIASVTCTCERPDPAVCAGQRIPPAVERRLARVCTSFDGAATKRTPPLRRLRRDVASLGGSLGAVAKARKKGRISNDCAAALQAELRDTKDRAARMLVSLSGR
jgi:Beta-propeller repeat